MWPEWLLSAYGDLRAGVREKSGSEAHPRIVAWFHALGADHVSSDETPNCAAFVGFHLLRAGIPRDRLPGNPLGARQYLRFGTPISAVHPPVGSVVVLKRAGEEQPGPEVLDALGHTGFFFGHSYPGTILVLGANQGDRVAIEPFPLNRVLGFRYPSDGGSDGWTGSRPT